MKLSVFTFFINLWNDTKSPPLQFLERGQGDIRVSDYSAKGSKVPNAAPLL